jgi:hypothetical protein
MLPGLLVLAVVAPSTSRAHVHPPQAPGVGSLVSVSVEIEGRTRPLYGAPDHSGRFYVEALPQTRYALHLANRTGERLGVVTRVDGLNVISGELDRAGRGVADRVGPMYVLGPWESITIQGWRTSLDEVRRFTFVDEKRSYAARSGQANAKMGWIELAVYRERNPRPSVGYRRGREIPPPYEGPRTVEPEKGAHDQGAPAEAEESARSDDAAGQGRLGAAAPRSYPGTGWGERTEDAAVRVDFEHQPHPAERLTLRYEYASALRALGIDVRPWHHTRDRLRERDRGEDVGFAKPPAW